MGFSRLRIDLWLGASLRTDDDVNKLVNSMTGECKNLYRNELELYKEAVKLNVERKNFSKLK